MSLASILVMVRALLAPPEEAIELAAEFENAPEYVRELKSISFRESRHQDVGVHKIDAWASRKAHRKALDRGWLDPSCVFHRDPDAGWSSRGNFGMFAAYHLRYLGDICLPPEVMDNAFISAVIAIRKMRFICKRYGACTKKERRWVWSGLSVYYRMKYHEGI